MVLTKVVQVVISPAESCSPRGGFAVGDEVRHVADARRRDLAGIVPRIGAESRRVVVVGAGTRRHRVDEGLGIRHAQPHAALLGGVVAEGDDLHLHVALRVVGVEQVVGDGLQEVHAGRIAGTFDAKPMLPDASRISMMLESVEDFDHDVRHRSRRRDVVDDVHRDVGEVMRRAVEVVGHTQLAGEVDGLDAFDVIGARDGVVIDVVEQRVGEHAGRRS